MLSPTSLSIGAAIFMAGLFVQALVFRALHDDPPSMYKLYAVRDMLIRLVVETKIARDEPHFLAIYENVNTFLQASRCIAGPSGWPIAEEQGKFLAHHPKHHVELKKLPNEPLPESLDPVMNELRNALLHLLSNHFGIFVQFDAQRREAAKLQKENAKALLHMMYSRNTSDREMCAA
jgi:hypothetical protein